MDLHRDAMAEIVALYVGLLCIDELGYKQLDHRCAVRLFQMLTEREEGGPVAIESNESSVAGPRPSPLQDSPAVEPRHYRGDRHRLLLGRQSDHGAAHLSWVVKHKK